MGIWSKLHSEKTLNVFSREYSIFKFSIYSKIMILDMAMRKKTP